MLTFWQVSLCKLHCSLSSSSPLWSQKDSCAIDTIWSQGSLKETSINTALFGHSEIVFPSHLFAKVLCLKCQDRLVWEWFYCASCFKKSCKKGWVHLSISALTGCGEQYCVVDIRMGTCSVQGEAWLAMTLLSAWIVRNIIYMISTCVTETVCYPHRNFQATLRCSQLAKLLVLSCLCLLQTEKRKTREQDFSVPFNHLGSDWVVSASGRQSVGGPWELSLWIRNP